jgi:hypothetical protein
VDVTGKDKHAPVNGWRKFIEKFTAKWDWQARQRVTGSEALSPHYLAGRALKRRPQPPPTPICLEWGFENEELTVENRDVSWCSGRDLLHLRGRG